MSTQESLGRRGRRKDSDPDARDDILAAARDVFTEQGYGASLRGIATRANVDVALLHYYFGTKDRLLAAALDMPEAPSDLVARAVRESVDDLGEQLVRLALTAWGEPEHNAAITNILQSRTATPDHFRALKEHYLDAILGPLAAALADRAEYRAALASAHLAGLAILRHVIEVPAVADASVEDLVADVGPTLQHYLTGDLDSAHRRA